jgi:hypothetical protein
MYLSDYRHAAATLFLRKEAPISVGQSVVCAQKDSRQRKRFLPFLRIFVCEQSLFPCQRNKILRKSFDNISMKKLVGRHILNFLIPFSIFYYVVGILQFQDFQLPYILLNLCNLVKLLYVSAVSLLFHRVDVFSFLH